MYHVSHTFADATQRREQVGGYSRRRTIAAVGSVGEAFALVRKAEIDPRRYSEVEILSKDWWEPMDGCSALKRVYGLKSDITPCPIIHRHGRSVPLGGITLIQSITSSARTRNDTGIVKPSALAVTRLMTSSNLVGCSTGRSPGLIPRRILSTYSAARRYWPEKFGP